MTMTRETVYRERSGGAWHYWMYVANRTYDLTEAQAQTHIKRGAKLVTA